MVIIGALAAVSAPIFFGKNEFQQSGFHSEMLATVRYAQKLAVSSGCAVQVQVAGGTITLFQPAGAATCYSGPFITAVTDPSNSGNPFARSAPNGVSFSSSPATFVFCPLGDTSNGNCVGNYTRVNAAITAGTQSFNVVGITGHVR